MRSFLSYLKWSVGNFDTCFPSYVRHLPLSYGNHKWYLKLVNMAIFVRLQSEPNTQNAWEDNSWPNQKIEIID